MEIFLYIHILLPATAAAVAAKDFECARACPDAKAGPPSLLWILFTDRKLQVMNIESAYMQ